ncbi:MAG TPA: Na/Pi cotransporter family protein [Devosia sp.]|nr:Na/Pi cotransporter family protein [Devosia sp.]
MAVLGLLGAIALFLWGTHMAQTGVQRALGPRLRRILGTTLSNRVKAFFAGIGLTLLLQSSTATGLMAASFTANGIVDLLPAMAVVLGANVGTALIVQVLSFDISIVSPVLVLAGYLMFRRSENSMLHDLGRALVGLGLMLLALHQMLAILGGVENAVEFRAAIGIVAAVPALGFVLAALAAWGVHSSVAIVLLVMSLATHGALPLDVAFVSVLGANFGTAINPLLELSTPTREARRLPLGNLLNRVLGIVVALFVVGPAARWLGQLLAPGQAVATFHLLFNLVLALCFLPFLRPAGNLLKRLMPAQPAANPAAPLYLDRSARETPLVALGGAAREALRLADVLEEMLHGARDALARGDRRKIEETRDRDDVLDGLNTAIKTYLTSIEPESLADVDQRRLNQILVFSMNIEQAGDVIDRNLLPHVSKRLKRGLVGTNGADAELAGLMDRLVTNLRTAASLFMTDDARVARQLAEEKVTFRRAEREAVASHFDIMRSDRQASGMSSAIHLDLLRDMKLINSLIVAAAAYPVLDKTGELLPTRLVAQS